MTGFASALGKIGHFWLKVFTKCADESLNFQSASNNLIGLLTVGNVRKGSTVIGDYVIEWRKDSDTGEIVLISGVGSDPAIQTFHPFSSEPVIGGNLHAVIRYVWLDGVKYSPYFRQGQYSPDLKNCLGTVTVQNITCSNGSAGTYSHTISYTNNINPSNNAERTLQLDLNSDGSTRFIAWQFTGQYVADQLTISYVRASDTGNPIILTNWIIGANATTNYTSNPKVYGSGNQTLKNVLGITQTYETGDYLLIHITPRVLEPTNNNTNWSLYLKCLSTFDTTTTPINARTFDFSSFTMVWDSVNCQWNLKWRYIGNYTLSNQMYTYLQLGSYSANATYGGNVSDSGSYFRKKTFCNGMYVYPYNVSCLNQSGTATIQKSGNIATFTFSNQTDYDRYKTQWDTIQASPYFTNYTTDNSNINHFKYYVIYINIANNCGDTITQKWLTFMYNSVWTWDYANKTFSIEMLNTTSAIPSVDCNTTHDTVENLITSVNSYINQTDFNVTTSCCATVPIAGYYYYNSAYDENSASITWGLGIPNQALIEGWTAPSEWIQNTMWNMFGWIGIRAFIQITYYSDPANNFRVSNYLNEDGTLKTTPVIIYEKSLGVQIIP